MSLNSVTSTKWTTMCLGFVMSMIIVMSLVAKETSAQGSSRYIERQLICALDRGPCDPLGQQIKDALPEIIGRQCATCNQRQVGYARRIAKFIQNKYPVAWNALVEKYSTPLDYVEDTNNFQQQQQ